MRWRPAVLIAALLVAAAVLVASAPSSSGDYQERAAGGLDNPAPAIRALADGDLDRFGRVQPIMGLGSMALRVPVVAAADEERLGYQLGAFLCLLAAAAVGTLLALRVRRHGGSWAAALLVGVACVASPAAFDAVSSGHPEEVLVAALGAGAVLASASERWVWAAVLLGLAVGSKQWALVAGAPVLLAATGRRPRIGIAAGAAVLALALMAPGPLIDSGAYGRAARAVGGTHAVTPVSAWWPLHTVKQRPGAAADVLPGGLTRTSASAFLLLFAAPAVWLFGRRLGGGRLAAALGLLALLSLLRCVLDPQPLAYYYAPVVLAVAAWESKRSDRLPVATLLTAAATWVWFWATRHLPAGGQLALVAAGALALSAHLISSTRSTSSAARSTSAATSGGSWRKRPST